VDKLRGAAKSMKARAFARGFVAGLSAPALLMAGVFEAPVDARRTTMADSVAKAGGYLRVSPNEVRRLSGKRG